MTKNVRRWKKGSSLIRQIFRPTYGIILEYPKLITKLELYQITSNFMRLFAARLQTFEEFEHCLQYLSKLKLDEYYFNIYIMFLCKFDFGLFLFEKFALLKNSIFNIERLFKLQNLLGRQLICPSNWDWHEIAYNYYTNIYYNYCNFHYNAIPYINYKNMSTYHYFNICRLCCESEPKYFDDIEINAFGTKTIKYYLRLARYLQLIYQQDIKIKNISKLKEDDDKFFAFMPVTSDSIKFYNSMSHSQINLTVALAQSFTVPVEVPDNIPKTKVFKFNNVELDSVDIRFIIDEVQKIN